MTNQQRFDDAWWLDCQQRVNHAYKDDCERICKVAMDRLGIRMTTDQAAHVWEVHSEAVCVGWLIIHSDEEIEGAVRAFANL